MFGRWGTRRRRGAWVAAAVVLAIGGLPAIADAAPWTTPVQWNATGDGGAGVASTAVAATPAGDALAIWAATPSSAYRARWQYADGSFSAVFDPLAGSGLAVVNGVKLAAWGDRQAVIAFSGQPTLSDPLGIYARRIADTTPGALVDVSAPINTATRSIGASFTLAGATDGTAVVGLFDADKNQPSGASTAEVRNAHLRVLPPGGSPGPLQLVDTQNDRTELVSTGLPPPNDVLPATSAGTEQPAFWLNADGKGVVAVRRLVDPPTGTARVYRLRRFDTATGTMGAPFSFAAPGPDPFAIGTSAFTVGPDGDGSLFWSLVNNPTSSGLPGTAARSWSGSSPGAPATLDAASWGQTVNAARDDAGRTIVAWTRRFDSNPHPTLTVRRLGADLTELRANEELPAPTGLLGLAPAANGARLFYRRLISGTSYELSDQALPADGPAAASGVIGSATNITLASAPMRAADGSLILALRQRGTDLKDELWVTRLSAAAAGGASAPPPAAGAAPAGSTPGPATPAAGGATRPGLRRVGAGKVKVGRAGSGALRLSCAASTACTVKLKGVKGRTVLATLNGKVPSGRAAALTLRLTKAGRARLGGKGRTLALILKGTVTAGGVSSPVTIRLTVKRA